MAFKQQPQSAQTNGSHLDDPVLDGIDALFEKAHAAGAAGGRIAIQAMRLNRIFTAENFARMHFEKDAITDALTELKNRRGMMDTLTQQIHEMERFPSRACLIAFVDLDGFKALNDNCGHEKGDEALKEVAKRLQGTFRKTDIIARPGGDEIVVILPLEAGEGYSRTAAKYKIRQALDGLVFWNDKQQPFPVGASIGFCFIDGHTLPDLDAVTIADNAVKTADHNMYMDKWHNGHESTLDGGREDLRHPKNKRLEEARQKAYLSKSNDHDITI